MVIFSIGEMLASPKFSEFLGNIAPPDKKAMWIGFSQAPILIGWTIEGKLGPDALSHLLVQGRLRPPDARPARPLARRKSRKRRCLSARPSTSWSNSPAKAPEHLTQTLYQSHHIGLTWYVFAAIGVASAVMIYFYGQWILKLAKQEDASAAAPPDAAAKHPPQAQPS